MRKSQLIPKVCAAAVFLIAALVISIPVFSVVLNRIFGGGVVQFGEAGAVEYLENRPVEGNLSKIIGCTSSDSGNGFTLKKGTYYYLVSVTGTGVSKDNKNDVILLKTLGSSNSYEELNELFRKQSSLDESIQISGVVKKVTSDEEKIAKQLGEDKNIKDVKYVNYCIDCTKPVSKYMTRFFISLIFYAGFVISLLLSIQAVKKNRDIDDMEHRRAVMQAARDLKSGNANADGTEALFGDADRSFVTANTHYQGEGSSPTEVAQNLKEQSNQRQSQNNQYQGNGQYQNTQQNFNQDDSGFFGQQNSSDDKYDGFFGS